MRGKVSPACSLVLRVCGLGRLPLRAGRPRRSRPDSGAVPQALRATACWRSQRAKNAVKNGGNEHVRGENHRTQCKHHAPEHELLQRRVDATGIGDLGADRRDAVLALQVHSAGVAAALPLDERARTTCGYDGYAAAAGSSSRRSTIGTTAIIRTVTGWWSENATAHFIHCPDAARSPFAPTRRRRAPKSAVEGGLEVRTARDA